MAQFRCFADAACRAVAGGPHAQEAGRWRQTFPEGSPAREYQPWAIGRGNTASAAYASHVLEHLSLEEARIAIGNTFKMLAPGGVFRLIVPDLEWRAEMYLANMRNGDANAASEFTRQCILGREERYRGPLHWLRKQLSGSSHLWMWDFGSVNDKLSVPELATEAVRSGNPAHDEAS